MPYLPQIKILVPSAQVSSYTTGVLSLPSAKGAFVPLLARGVFGGGYLGGRVNTIDYIDITTTGNATDFGDLTAIRDDVGAVSSTTRGVIMGGGVTGGSSNVIDYITIATTGNATTFGTLIEERHVGA